MVTFKFECISRTTLMWDCNLKCQVLVEGEEDNLIRFNGKPNCPTLCPFNGSSVKWEKITEVVSDKGIKNA